MPAKKKQSSEAAVREIRRRARLNLRPHPRCFSIALRLGARATPGRAVLPTCCIREL
jgi:hypothetical protein